MAYAKQTWVNGVAGGTPINATRLNYLEDGVFGAVHPPSTSYIIYCDNLHGSNSNSGKSPDKAKLTLDAALDAIPELFGGQVFCITRGTGYYDVTVPWVFTVPTYIRGLGPDSVSLRRRFNGDMFTWKTAGGMSGLTIEDDGLGSAARTGAAIKIMADSAAVRASSLDFNTLRVTSSEALGSWERIVHMDGALAPVPQGNGVRRIHISDCDFFGSRIPGETVLIHDGVHVFIQGSTLGVPAPTNPLIRQGVKVTSSNPAGVIQSDQVHFIGCEILGDLYIQGFRVSWVGGFIGSTTSGQPPVVITSDSSECYVDAMIYPGGTTVSTVAGTDNSVFDRRKRVFYMPTEAFAAEHTIVPLTTSRASGVGVTGEGDDRFYVRGDGLHAWGTGAGGFDTTLYRQAAGRLRSDQTFEVKRLHSFVGTVVTNGDFSVSAGWGASASVSVAAQSRDQRGQVTVTANGAGLAANPTLTLTYKDGAWLVVPNAIVKRNGGTAATTTPDATWAANTSTLVITFPGTPVAGETHTFEWMVMG